MAGASVCLAERSAFEAAGSLTEDGVRVKKKKPRPIKSSKILNVSHGRREEDNFISRESY